MFQYFQNIEMQTIESIVVKVVKVNMVFSHTKLYMLNHEISL